MKSKWRLWLIATYIFFAFSIEAQVEPIAFIESNTIGRGSVEDVAWQVDGETIIVAGSNGVYIYSQDFQRIISHIPINSTGIEINHDGSIIAAYQWQDGLSFFDFTASDLLHSFPAEAIWAIAWHPKTNSIAISQANENLNTTTLWNVDLSSELFQFEVCGSPHDRVNMLAWHPAGKQLAGTSGNNIVCIWDGTNGHLLKHLEFPTNTISQLTWDPSGDRLIATTTSLDAQPKIIAWEAGTDVFTEIPFPHEFAGALSWSPDGSRIAIGAEDGIIQILSGADFEPTETLTWHDKTIENIAWHPDNNELVSLDKDNNLAIWNISDQEPLTIFTGHSFPSGRAYWNPQQDILAVTYQESSDLLLLNPMTGESLYTLSTHSMVAQALGVSDILWSPDGNFIAAAFEDDVVDIWNISESPFISTTLSLDTPGRLPSIAWNSGSDRLAVAWGIDNQRQINIWNTTDNFVAATLEEKIQPYMIAWSPDNTRIVSFTWDHSLALWDTDSSRLISLYSEFDGIYPVNLPVWSTDSSQLIGVGCHPNNECLIWVWDLESNHVSELIRDSKAEIGTFRDGNVSIIALNPDGNLLAISDLTNRSVHIIDIRSDDLISTLDGFVNNINSISWNPEGNMIAISDGVIHIWQMLE